MSQTVTRSPLLVCSLALACGCIFTGVPSGDRFSVAIVNGSGGDVMTAELHAPDGLTLYLGNVYFPYSGRVGTSAFPIEPTLRLTWQTHDGQKLSRTFETRGIRIGRHQTLAFVFYTPEHVAMRVVSATEFSRLAAEFRQGSHEASAGCPSSGSGESSLLTPTQGRQ
jgi:hypothetical protein